MTLDLENIDTIDDIDQQDGLHNCYETRYEIYKTMAYTPDDDAYAGPYPSWLDCIDTRADTPAQVEASTFIDIMDKPGNYDIENIGTRMRIMGFHELEKNRYETKFAVVMDAYQLISDKWLYYHSNPVPDPSWFPSIDESDNEGLSHIVETGGSRQMIASQLRMVQQEACNTDRTCALTQHKVQVRTDYYLCIDCSQNVSIYYCKGYTDCHVSAFDQNAMDTLYTNLNDFITDDLKEYFDDYATDAKFSSSVMAMNFMIECFMVLYTSSTSSETNMQDVFDSATPAWPRWSTHQPQSAPGFTYTPEATRRWQDSLGILDARGERSLSVCMSGDETNTVSYATCSRNEHLEHINSQVKNDYMHNTSLWVQRYQGFSHNTIRAALIGINIPAFASTVRKKRDVYLEWIFSPDRCLDTRPDDSICIILNNTIRLINPWTGGDFNALGVDLCDVVPDSLGNTLYHTKCHPSKCINEPSAERSTVEFYKGQASVCYGLHSTRADPLSPTAAASGNVCNLLARKNATCMHQQGMLGGWDGAAAPDLYLYADLGDFPESAGGLFIEPRSDVLRVPFTTTRQQYGVVSFHAGDITGHHLRFKVDALGVLRLDNIFLKSHTTVASAAMMPSMSQPQWFTFDEQLEHTRNMQREPVQPATVSWDCPLKQRMYLSAKEARFHPTAPSARRAQIMFSLLHGTRRVHPTQDTTSGAALAPHAMFTANGVCLCQTWSQCRMRISTLDGSCSFRDTVDSFKAGAEERQSKFIQSDKCLHAQDDWPYTGGTMRDGSVLPKTERAADSEECSRVQRLHEFKFQYTYDDLDHAPAKHDTLDDGGDCHMGVATTWNYRFANERTCHRTAQDEFFCAADDDVVIDVVFPDNTPVVPTLTQQIERMRHSRTKCNTCQRPPAYVADGVDIPAEVSSGVPFRVGSDRFIAGHFRNMLTDQLCKSRTGCHELDALVNTSSWVPAKFWDAFLHDTSKLFQSDKMLPTAPSSTSDRLTEQSTASLQDALWQTPWIFCQSLLAMCVKACDPLHAEFALCEAACFAKKGGDNVTCAGTSSQADWTSHASRNAMCTLALNKEMTDSVVPDISVCDMDATMNAVCETLNTAKNKIREANCIMAGECQLTTFFYQPSMYSITNNQFVRQTVIDFYKQINADSCPSDDIDNVQLLAQNSELREKCPSVQLERVVEVLQMLRSVVDLVVRAQYYFFMFVINMLRTLVSVINVEAVRAEAAKWFDLLLVEVTSLVKLVADFTFDWIMSLDGTVGEVFKAIMKVVCIVTKFIYDVFYIQVFCPIKTELLVILIGIRDIFVDIKNVSILGFKPFDALLSPTVWMFNNIIDMMQKSECDPDNSPICDFEPPADEYENPALPITTRCWSTYTTSLGDAASLSCTAADTCKSDVGDNIVCNTCPAVQDTDGLMRFGCHAALKMCRCSVLKNERTPCISHEKCLPTSNSMCDIIDTGFEANPYGTVSCSSCSSKGICLLSLSNMVGYCACSQQELVFQGCPATDVGKSVMPSAEKLCLATIGALARTRLATSAVYTVAYNALAAAPCLAADRSSMFCYRVYRGMNDFSTYAVAVNTLWESSAGRRLLADNGDETQAPTTLAGFLKMADFFNIDATRLHDVMWGDWGSVRSEACTWVPQMRAMNESTMAVSDRMLLLECVRRRSVGLRVVQLFDAQDVIPDTIFVSINDFAHALEDPAVVSALITRPHMLLMAALHSPQATPLRSAVRAGRIWMMHTVLEMQQVKADMVEELASNDNGTVCSVFGTLQRVNQMGQCNVSLALSQSASSVFFVTHWFARLMGLSSQSAEHVPRSEHGINVHVKNAHMFMETATRRRPGHTRKLRAHGTSASDTSTFNTAKRKLLGYIETIESVQDFTVSVVLGDGATQIVSGEQAAAYVSGPVEWPPKYVYWDATLKCAPVTNLFDLTVRCVNLLWMYYDTAAADRPIRPQVKRGLSYAFDGFQLKTIASDNTTRASALGESYMAQFVHAVLDLVGVRTAHVRAFLVAAPDVLKRFVICDVDAVMFCSEQHHSLVNSFIAMAVTCLVLIIVSSFFGMTFVTSLVVLGFIAMTVFYAFGYSPLCAPMLPTCLMEELAFTVRWLLPQRIEWPASIQRVPDCANNVSSRADLLTSEVVQCIIPCSEHPFLFTSWEDVFMFTVCDLSADACESTVTAIRLLGDVILPGTDEWHRRLLERAIWKRDMVSVADADMLAGYRYCAVVSSWMLALPFAVLFIGTMLLTSIVNVLFNTTLQIINVIVGVGIVSHTNES